MSTQKDVTKLRIFPQSVPEKMEAQLDQIFWLVRENRISKEKAAIRFKHCRDDMISIYNRIQRAIDATEKSISDYEQFAAPRKSGQGAIGTTKRAIQQLFTACERRTRGEISKRDLRRISRLTRKALKADYRSLQNDVSTAISQAEQSNTPVKTSMDWREAARALRQDRPVNVPMRDDDLAL